MATTWSAYSPERAARIWQQEIETARRIDWRVANEREAARQFGLSVQRLALDILSIRGHPVAPACYADHHDLTANGVRVEVKAAKWGRHGAFRFNMRQSDAELYLLACCSEVEVEAWFIVPAAAINGQKIIGIWSENAKVYKGQWAVYLEAWQIADHVIGAGGGWPQQLGLGI